VILICRRVIGRQEKRIMKANFPRAYFIGVLLVCLAGSAGYVYGQVNSFSNPGSGTFKWETGVDWSLNIPPETDQSAFITNAVSAPPLFHFRTVLVDSNTAASPVTMTVSNLTVAGVGSFSGSHNNLLLSNTGSATLLLVKDSLTISANGTLNITNSILGVGTNLFIDGGLFLNTGTLGTDASTCGLFCLPDGAFTVLGHNGAGALTMTDGRWESGPVQLGSSLITFGTVTISGGSVTMEGSIDNVGIPLNIANGTVWLTGGTLDVAGAMYIGDAIGEVGQMIISNGTWITDTTVYIGAGGGTGTLSVEGASVGQGQFYVGTDANSHGAVEVDSGTVFIDDLVLGYDSFGQMTISNGTVTTEDLVLGENPGSAGTLTVAGGTYNVYDDMFLSAVDCSATGVVIIAGGNVNVTNASGTAVLEVNSGTLTLSGGTLRVDNLVLTNCAHFVRTGGTLIYGSATLDPNGDADGDGIPNGYEQAHGLNPFDPADAALDSDGDGMSNLQEYLAGTDATNSASVFRITSVVRSNNDLRITWMMGSGRTNALQVTSGAGNGSYATNSFASIFTVTNTVGTLTNYLDVGGATNKVARFYRVRLVP
jgi:T5SS/PEP-CTERM-associated repeat protein